MAERPEDSIAVPAPLTHLRRFPLDGALLLFERRTGLTAICDGPETAHLRLRAPRVVQFAITNACNLACTFCSRDTSAESAWTAGDAFTLLRDLSLRGTLEVAFGGGEPLAFKGFADLVRRLYEETELAVSLTTNGTAITDRLLAALVPHVGQVRLSVYDDVDHRPAAGRQVIVHAPYTVTMPPIFGALFYAKGGRVETEIDHAHDELAVEIGYRPADVRWDVWRKGA